jgi:hypothetical protein
MAFAELDHQNDQLLNAVIAGAKIQESFYPQQGAYHHG